MRTLLSTLSLSAMLLLSCSSNTETKAKTTNIPTQASKSEKSVPTKAPIINIEDSVEIKRMVLCIKDSSKNMEGMNVKLADIYNIKLAEAIKVNKLKITDSPIAWQTMQKGAYFFEAGIPVDKKPSKMGKGMYMKNTGGDSALIAHFWGPAELRKAAYDALNEKLKDEHKTKNGSSYEIYQGNHFAADKNDPYKLQTDIVVPYK